MNVENEQKAIEIVRRLQENGFEALFVGGCVRDKHLGIPCDDIDIATNANLRQVQDIFPGCVEGVGTNFQVNIVDGFEVATYRSDVYGPGGLSVAVAASFKDDSERRDLTINSLGYDPISGETFDYWGGLEDLQNRVVRFVEIASARIHEDPIRMIRACRFAAKINGKLVPSAFFAIKDYAHLIDTIPQERIQKEILKALETDKPSIFWELLHRTGLLNRIIPELDDCWYHDGGNYHSEFVHEHLLDCGDAIDKSNPIVRLAGYLHDIGKVEAYDERDFSFINHEKFGTDVARDILVRLRFPTDVIERVYSLILLHMRCVEVDSTPKTFRKTVVKLEKHNLSVSDFLVLKIADRKANRSKEEFTPEEINSFIDSFNSVFEVENAAFSVKDLKINGNDVLASGVKPGKNVGRILNYYFDLVVEHPEYNDRSTLLDFLNSVDDWSDCK